MESGLLVDKITLYEASIVLTRIVLDLHENMFFSFDVHTIGPFKYIDRVKSY